MNEETARPGQFIRFDTGETLPVKKQSGLL
jgi:hypothetical protein